jgi:hypothetical protein
VKALVRFVIAILLVLVVSVVVIGPGRLVAGAEYPMGVGPWGSTGRYCQHMYSLTQLMNDKGQPLTTKVKTTFRALEKSVTMTGPVVPRADFSAFFKSAVKAMNRETALLNKWWDQNCTQMWMEAPSSLNRTWSGMIGHESFTHYPKNVVRLENFFRITG